MTAEVARQHAGVKVISAANVKAYIERQVLASIEILETVRLGGKLKA